MWANLDNADRFAGQVIGSIEEEGENKDEASIPKERRELLLQH